MTGLLARLLIVAIAASACTTQDAVGWSCDQGTTTTDWATTCATSATTPCAPGEWLADGSPNADDALLTQSPHFAVYSNGVITQGQAQAITDELENAIWPVFFSSPIFLPEPFCSMAVKHKTSVMVRDGSPITGATWGANSLGIWLAPSSVDDHWALAFSFVGAMLSQYHGLDCAPGAGDTCNWFRVSYANFMAHQLAEFRSDMNCSELFVNAPHLYLGSTRNRYCNWQFLEYLKDTHCYEAVNALWTTTTPGRDPFANLAATQGWSASQLNDFFGQWAMHNITWDYVDPAPGVSSVDPGTAFRATYGDPADVSSTPYRRLRLTRLDPLEPSFATGRRFVSPYLWAPQRWGYNVVRLYPDRKATTMTVTFRGVTQEGASSDWRWGVVRTDASNTSARYSRLQRGADGTLMVCVSPGENVWLVVMATPSVTQSVFWDQPFPTIYRYPYMLELENAWPQGFVGGQLDACPSGLSRHANGGGCALASVPDSVYVGPFAQVLGGDVSGTARIEDHATILSGRVTGGTVGGLSVVSGVGGTLSSMMTVGGAARLETSFYPVGIFEPFQSITGSARLYGDVELRGARLTVSSGNYTGFVDGTSPSQSITEVTTPPPYAWRR